MPDNIRYILNGKVITPSRIIENGGLRMAGGEITHVFSGKGPMDYYDEAGAAVIDVKGDYVCPGFIDLHLHGGGGADFMDGTVEAIDTVCKAHAKGGSTSILATTLTSSDADLRSALEAFRKAEERHCPLPGSRPFGIHMEGPYFCDAQRGAQDPRYLKNPSPDHYEPLLEEYPEILRVSAAPELPGALELGRRLRLRGILASAGHTDATFEQIEEALDAGYTHMTHLYSGMSGVRRIMARRVAGAVEAGLLLDSLTVEIIADGVHLPPSLLRLIYKCKGPSKIALITDALRAAGMPEGEYKLGSSEDGQKIIVDEGVAWLPDRTAFAGSVALANRLVRNMVELAGAPLKEAVEMMSLTPARIIGMDSVTGSLDPGKRADVVILDDKLDVRMTIVAGTTVYEA